VINLTTFFDQPPITLDQLIRAARDRYAQEHGIIYSMTVDMERSVVVVNGTVEFKFSELVVDNNI